MEVALSPGVLASYGVCEWFVGVLAVHIAVATSERDGGGGGEGFLEFVQAMPQIQFWRLRSLARSEFLVREGGSVGPQNS